MALKYGLTRKIDLYDVDTHEGLEVISTTGDYLKAHMWLNKNLKSDDEELRDILQAYAWAYYALARTGNLGKFSLESELTKDILFSMADHMTVFLNPIEDGSLPLANSQTQPK